MPSERFDIIVLGVGAMGAAAVYALAKRGVRVLGIERFGVGHDLGSSHGETRIFRIAYYEHPDYVPLLTRALHAWRDLEAESRETLLHRCGGIWFGCEGGPLIRDTAAAARAHGLAHELFTDQNAVVERFPQFAALRDSGMAAFFEPDAGALLPETAVRAFARLAVEHGATIRERERVLEWSADARRGGGVRVRTNRSTYDAEHLIITAGPWSAEVLGDCGLTLTVTRQPAAWFELRADPAMFEPPRLPCFAVEKDERGFYYGFPLVHSPLQTAMKVSIHEVREAADPETIDRSAREGEVAELKAAIDRIFPGCFGACVRTSICMYTNSPDGHFIIDRHPDHPQRVTIACGFSGHGFKFAPVIGEALADLALRGVSDLPIDFLSLKRFD